MRSRLYFGEEVFCELPRPQDFDVVLMQDDGFGESSVVELDLVDHLAAPLEGFFDALELLAEEGELLKLFDLYVKFNWSCSLQ
jgi:hypothetical protein